MKTPSSETLSRASQRIAVDIDHIDRMLRELLDLERCPRRCSSCEILRLVSVVLDGLIPVDRQRVVVTASSALRVYVNTARIQRVIATLVANAIDRTAGHVVVEVCPSDIGVRVSVTDAGPAPDPATLGAAFTRTSRLGVYVCKLIIEAHGGRIAGEPHGNGTRFYFDLPPG